MAENFSKSDKNYGLPHLDLIPINRDQPGVAKANAPVKKAPEKSESRLVPIIMLVVFGLIAASLLYYFFWDSDNPTPVVEDNTPTQEDRVTLDESESSDAAESTENVTDDVTESGSETPSSEPVSDETASDQPGSISTISQRTDRYYIFLGSYKFKQYARRHAEKLAADGFAVKLITPDNWVGMRVAIGNYASVAEASADANMIRNKYGNEVVVSKY